MGLNPEWGRSLEYEMPTHSSSLAWRIPWTEEPGGLQSLELQRVTQLDTEQTYTYRVPSGKHQML